MSPEEIKAFKEKVVALQSLETSLACQRRNLEVLELATASPHLYLKIEVAAGGTNKWIHLDQAMTDLMYNHLKTEVLQEIHLLEKKIAFL